MEKKYKRPYFVWIRKDVLDDWQLECVFPPKAEDNENNNAYLRSEWYIEATISTYYYVINVGKRPSLRNTGKIGYLWGK